MNQSDIQPLLSWLHENRSDQGPYIAEPLKRYFRIACKNGTSAYCFIVKEDFTSKTLGSNLKGDLLCPSTWSAPAKHARGKLYDPQTWEKTFTSYGMRMLKK